MPGALLSVRLVSQGVKEPVKAAARSGSLTPWLWGPNGTASVLASVVAFLIVLGLESERHSGRGLVVAPCESSLDGFAPTLGGFGPRLTWRSLGDF